MISGREAVRRITATGVGERQARRALACGVAGAPLRVGRTLLYDEATVAALVARPELDPLVLVRDLGCDLVVTRRSFDVTADEEQQRRELAVGWRMGLWTALTVQMRARERGSLPLIATLAGFVLGGADLLDVGGCGNDRTRFELREPGPWFDQLSGSRIHGGYGRDWVLVEPVQAWRRDRGESVA